MLYFNFQKLEIYKFSKELVKDIYELSRSFTSDEKDAFVQKINRAVVSVTSNIAERTSRNGCQEKIHFICINQKMQYLNNISTTFKPCFV
ncbi:MAG: four helix bundle protein [Bacteroidota bacterium]|nr:four helix bundle protein [Bacteroidota bacterium]